MSIISESISRNMGRRHTLVALVAVLGVMFLTRADGKCFHIDGSSADDTFEPCDADASASGCCASNKSRPDICLTSGLCYAQEFGFEGLIFSNGCTDKSGQAKGCPTVCPQGAESNPNRLYCPAGPLPNRVTRSGPMADTSCHRCGRLQRRCYHGVERSPVWGERRVLLPPGVRLAQLLR